MSERTCSLCHDPAFNNNTTPKFERPFIPHLSQKREARGEKCPENNLTASVSGTPTRISRDTTRARCLATPCGDDDPPAAKFLFGRKLGDGEFAAILAEEQCWSRPAIFGGTGDCEAQNRHRTSAGIAKNCPASRPRARSSPRGEKREQQRERERGGGGWRDDATASGNKICRRRILYDFMINKKATVGRSFSSNGATLREIKRPDTWWTKIDDGYEDDDDGASRDFIGIVMLYPPPTRPPAISPVYSIVVLKRARARAPAALSIIGRYRGEEGRGNPDAIFKRARLFLCVSVSGHVTWGASRRCARFNLARPLNDVTSNGGRCVRIRNGRDASYCSL